MSEWNMLVKKIFDEKRSKNSAYRLGDAMRDAKKVYKKTAKTAKGMLPFGKQRKVRRTRRRGRGRRRRGGQGDDNYVDGQKEQNSEKDQNQSNSLFGGLF